MKPRLAFVDHSFHEKTQSSKFFTAVLEKRYTVSYMWDYSWCGGPPVDIKEIIDDEYDIIIFWQKMPSGEVLQSVPPNKVVLVPMYDQIHRWKNNDWTAYGKHKIICFCKRLYNYLTFLGLNAEYFQYFPQPVSKRQKKEEGSLLAGFFWLRTEKLQWDSIRVLIGNTHFNPFYLHYAPDDLSISAQLPSPEERQTYNLHFSEWFFTQEDYYKVLDMSDVYFAPRLCEGIGLSFLEAMARGICVVAPDYGTMNEYIEDHATGLLYDYDHLVPLDFTDAKRIGANARDYIADGWKRWININERILDFVNEERCPGVHGHGCSEKNGKGVGLISSYDDIPMNIKIALYGASDAGRLFRRRLQQYRPDVSVVCFIDSYKEGKYDGLDVFPIEFIDKNKHLWERIYITSASVNDISTILAKRQENHWIVQETIMKDILSARCHTS
jgi:glycosyltransferase involved in cell wall biosynthesis